MYHRWDEGPFGDLMFLYISQGWFKLKLSHDVYRIS